MQTQKQPTVAIKGLIEDFPGIRASSGVSLEVYPGEIHALIGENGAGKSAIIKILMGVYSRTTEEIYVEGELKKARSPIRAQSFGFDAVCQDVNLAQHLSVVENFFMGQLPKTKLGTVDFKEANRATQEILEFIHVHVDPKAIIRTLSVAQQGMVATGKTILQKAKLVISDEPTALLTNSEIQQFFQMTKQLKNSGVGILYVSHRMEKAFSICDRANVLKDGALVGTIPIDQTTQDQLISMMVGRNVENMYQIQHQALGEAILRVNDIPRGKAFSNISFEVRKGKIFGMFGLVGSGRTETVRNIFGADVRDGGTVTPRGKQANCVKPTQGVKAGIALLPENRRTQGLALGLSISDNINMATQNKISRFGVVNNQESVKIAKNFCDKLRIKTPSVYQRVKNLSGGNQQKVVTSKRLEQDSDLFIFDESTVNVGVGAKLEIYKIFGISIKEGKTIIMVPSYLPEVMGLADRISIMYEGQRTGILSRDEFQEERVLRLAPGIKEKE